MKTLQLFIINCGEPATHKQARNEKPHASERTHPHTHTCTHVNGCTDTHTYTCRRSTQAQPQAYGPQHMQANKYAGRHGIQQVQHATSAHECLLKGRVKTCTPTKTQAQQPADGTHPICLPLTSPARSSGATAEDSATPCRPQGQVAGARQHMHTNKDTGAAVSRRKTAHLLTFDLSSHELRRDSCGFSFALPPPAVGGREVRCTRFRSAASSAGGNTSVTDCRCS